MDASEPNINAVFSSIRSFLIVIGTVMAGNGLATSGAYKWVEIVAGSIMVVGPAAWGVYNAFANYIASRKKTTAAVNATLHLATAGGVLVDRAGEPIPATDATAAQIVKSYAPSVAK
ncbi:MAG TPA: hypothetical protein VGG45_16535 [Terracidiphilus sp.]|jgi:hypothetical protein